MRIRLLDGCIGTDGTPWAAGDVHDVSEAFAHELVSYHRAEILGAETPAPVPTPDPTVIANHAAETTVRDPAPAKAKKRGAHR